MSTYVCESMCVCVCVCLSVCLPGSISPEPQARSLRNFFAYCPYGCGSVLLRRGDKIPKARDNFGDFLPYWQCIVQHSFWDPYKNGWTERNAVWVDDSGGPKVPRKSKLWGANSQICCKLESSRFCRTQGILLGLRHPKIESSIKSAYRCSAVAASQTYISTSVKIRQ